MEKKLNAVVGQSGGPTAAINSTLAGVISGCLNSSEIGTVYGMRNGIEGFMKESLIELNGYFDDEKELELLKLTPAAALGSCRLKITKEEQYECIFNVLDKYEIGYFFYIGGNDSMDAVAKLETYKREHPGINKLDTKFIGVPKTIDNDLCFTDHTPGFGSAAKFIASLLEEVARDCAVYQVKAVTIVEIMGRDAGWLTASAALTKKISGIGADLVYLPEVAFDENEFLADINALLEKPGKNYVIVAVSEGIRNKNGEYAAKSAMSGVKDSFGHAYLAGTGKYLENLVREKIGCKCRSLELSLLQRCASHIASKTDIEESFAIGNAAVGAAVSGKSGRMMIFVRDEKSSYKVTISDADVLGAANAVKTVPLEFISDDGKNVNEKCVDYLLPLIEGECETVYDRGIPKHFVF